MMEHVKCIIVGDGAVGKTSLLMSYSSNTFDNSYIPTVFDNYAVSIALDNKYYNLNLWDTAGQEEYDKLRSISYPGSDVILICFSIISPSSFKNIKQKWISEMKHYLPDTPIILVGNKIDLRNDIEIINKIKPISYEQGKELANELNCPYIECSSYTTHNVGHVFEIAIEEHEKNKLKKRQENKKNSCIII